MLLKLPNPDRIKLLLGFAHRIRHGHYGDGSKVQAGSIQVALHVVGKTFELDGIRNPTYRSKGKYWLKIQQVIKAYRQQDPPPQHKLAVPVAVVNHLVEISTRSTLDKLKASCDMATIAFYFLLPVGEYKGRGKKEQ
jgi:hypothetical protein